MSARGEHRVLRVARTIADLRASGACGRRTSARRLALRPDVSLTGSRAAWLEPPEGPNGRRLRKLPASRLAAGEPERAVDCRARDPRAAR